MKLFLRPEVLVSRELTTEVIVASLTDGLDLLLPLRVLRTLQANLEQ